MATNEAAQQANRSGMDPVRLVVIFYLVAGVVLGMFLDNVLEMLWVRFGWSNPNIVEGLNWKLTTLLGIAVALGGCAGAFVHPKSKQLSLEVASELMKVTWPSWGETRVSTVAVVVASLVAAVVLFGIDTLAYSVMVDWLPRLWSALNG